MTSIDNYILNNKPYKIVNNNIFTVKNIIIRGVPVFVDFGVVL